MPTFEKKIESIVRLVYPNSSVRIDRDGNVYDINVIGCFNEDSYEVRIEKIYNKLNEQLSNDEKECVGIINTFTNNEYAEFCHGEDHVDNDFSRWFTSPWVNGFILCDVFDQQEIRKCQSSFVCYSKDACTGEIHSVCENYIYEGSAYVFLSQEGHNILEYAKNHVFNLAPSFFIAPYMDKYMKRDDFSYNNPYSFAFRPLSFNYAEPDVNLLKRILDVDKLSQLRDRTTMDTIKNELNRLIDIITN